MNKLADKLYLKGKREYQQLLEEIEKLPPKEIINRAYEIVLKQDILMIFNEDDLSQKQIRGLYSLDYPLQAIYDDWLSNDFSYMEDLRYTACETADFWENERRKRKKAKEQPER